MNMEKQRIVVILGPTATGKTDAAVEFAKRFDGEIISADSMLIYRGMDIGTAKPDKAQQAAVPHHLIDICDPEENFSAAAWQQKAQEAIGDIAARGKLPVVAGGTGLYIRSLLHPTSFLASDPAVREKYEAIARQEGVSGLKARLAKVDPVSCEKLSDERRLVRALEVYELYGKPISAFHEEDERRKPPYNALELGVNFPREVLYRRIDRRVDKMLEMGLLEETKALLARGVPETATSMQALGYKEMALHLSGQLSLDEAKELLCRRTRNFAKRQITWFKKYADPIWLNADEGCELSGITAFFAEKFQEAF